MSGINKPKLREWLRRSTLLRFVEKILRRPYIEFVFVTNVILSGRIIVFLRNRAVSRRLLSQKVITYTVDLPPLRNFQTLNAWLSENLIRYQEGLYCTYIPPQEAALKVFGGILSAYPPNCGLKILKDLKPPDKAKYITRDQYSDAPEAYVRLSYSPLDYLRVANYMYIEEIGPRVYDLLEMQTSHNNLSAYVVQHVSGTAPTMEECREFISRLSHLYEDQLVPVIGRWQTASDFQCPECRGNLLRDENGRLQYIDFQTFMLRDAKQYIEKTHDMVDINTQCSNVLWRLFGKKLLNKVDDSSANNWINDSSWNLVKSALQKQGVSVKGSVIFDIGCNVESIYSALQDEAAWVVGWDTNTYIKANRRLLFSLGMTRFDLLDERLLMDPNSATILPEHIYPAKNLILLFRAPRNHIVFSEIIKNIPFKLMVYHNCDDQSLFSVEKYLNNIREEYGFRLADVSSYLCEISKREHIIAVLIRD